MWNSGRRTFLLEVDLGNMERSNPVTVVTPFGFLHPGALLGSHCLVHCGQGNHKFDFTPSHVYQLGEGKWAMEGHSL